MLSKEN